MLKKLIDKIRLCHHFKKAFLGLVSVGLLPLRNSLLAKALITISGS